MNAGADALFMGRGPAGSTGPTGPQGNPGTPAPTPVITRYTGAACGTWKDQAGNAMTVSSGAFDIINCGTGYASFVAIQLTFANDAALTSQVFCTALPADTVFTQHMIASPDGIPCSVLGVAGSVVLGQLILDSGVTNKISIASWTSNLFKAAFFFECSFVIYPSPV